MSDKKSDDLNPEITADNPDSNVDELTSDVSVDEAEEINADEQLKDESKAQAPVSLFDQPLPTQTEAEPVDAEVESDETDELMAAQSEEFESNATEDLLAAEADELNDEVIDPDDLRDVAALDSNETPDLTRETAADALEINSQAEPVDALDVAEQDDDATELTETETETETETDLAEIDAAAHDEIDLGEQTAEEDSSTERGDPYGGHEPEALKRILEAALFASGTTLTVNHLRDIFEKNERPHGRIVRQLMAELMAGYESRGVQLVEIASGYRFQTAAESAQWISRLWDEKPQRYSRALMETIALIAYRQPITRGEIEDVRGVAVSSNIIRTLLEREWVRVVGHRDVPGRPAMYATTRQFLDYFSLSSLEQLPSLSEIRDLDELNPQMSIDDGSDAEGASQSDSQSNQSEISFSGMIDKIREAQSGGKTGSEFIDEQLDDELAAMDEVNNNFEDALAKQKAEHEHPDLDLDAEDSEPELTNSANIEADIETAIEPHIEKQAIDSAEDGPEDSTDASIAESTQRTESNDSASNAVETELSEQEKWQIIQKKLAQQQALLDTRESDQSREENEDE